jgi:hypothetical protein
MTRGYCSGVATLAANPNVGRNCALSARIGVEGDNRSSCRRIEVSTEARYRAGIDSSLSLLDAQRELYSAQQSLIVTQLARETNLDVVQRSRWRMESGAVANGSQKGGHLGKNHGT